MDKIVVNDDIINEQIAKEEYIECGKKSVICLLTTVSGFEIVGHSSPINQSDYNVEIGKVHSKKKALDRLFQHEAYVAMATAKPVQLPEEEQS